MRASQVRRGPRRRGRLDSKTDAVVIEEPHLMEGPGYLWAQGSPSAHSRRLLGGRASPQGHPLPPVSCFHFQGCLLPSCWFPEPPPPPRPPTNTHRSTHTTGIQPARDAGRKPAAFPASLSAADRRSQPRSQSPGQGAQGRTQGR